MDNTLSPDSRAGTPSPANHNNSGPPRKKRRTLRIRVACVRCQRRKVRCDGVVPTCGACSKARVECEDGGKQDGIDTPRAYILSLKTRVQWLESVIQTNLPDFNLSQGPEVTDASGQVSNENQQQNPQAEGALSLELEPPVDANPPLSTAPITGEEQRDSNEQHSGLAHEIGLVSLSAGTDPKYIGPSSGYFFAKLLLACAKQGQRSAPTQGELQQTAESRLARFFPQGALSVPPSPLPESMEYTMKISGAYFEAIHTQYPFLHRPSHMKMIEHIYAPESEPSALISFQVHMVLAIGATVLSRRLKLPLSGEGYCASAMKYFDKFSIENSLKGLQSLLLLLVYTLNTPSMGLNVWYLNYQCIAAVLDLGLQRDVKSGKTLSVLDQELRTRTFWTIYSLDRSVATMMGRPIGLRDEACELRLPADVDDANLSATELLPRLESEPPTHMSSAIHLFRLAQLNSEMKYILHSISHDVPPYSYPNIPNILQWQNDIATRLRSWFNQIPQYTGDRNYMTKLCEIKYHSIMMLLMRPSPAIPDPSLESRKTCYESAVASIRLYDELYKRDLLIYSWVTVHSIFLSTLTMLHCLWTIPEVVAQIKLDALMADLKAGSNVLSATGEHWSEAKRSRDVLDELSGTTVRWIIESRAKNTDVQPRTPHIPRVDLNDNLDPHERPHNSLVPYSDSSAYPQTQSISCTQPQQPLEPDQNSGTQFYTSLFGDERLTDQVDFTSPVAVDAFMHRVFSDFQPMYDYGDFGMGQFMDVQL